MDREGGARVAWGARGRGRALGGLAGGQRRLVWAQTCSRWGPPRLPTPARLSPVPHFFTP